MWPNQQETVDLVTFTGKILNLIFCAVFVNIKKRSSLKNKNKKRTILKAKANNRK